MGEIKIKNKINYQIKFLIILFLKIIFKLILKNCSKHILLFCSAQKLVAVPPPLITLYWSFSTLAKSKRTKEEKM